jgi:hypothetical protein
MHAMDERSRVHTASTDHLRYHHQTLGEGARQGEILDHARAPNMDYIELAQLKKISNRVM